LKALVDGNVEAEFRSPGGLFDLLDRGPGEEGSPGVGEHLGEEPETPQRGDAEEFAGAQGKAAPAEDLSIGEPEDQVGQGRVEVRHVRENARGRLPVDLAEGTLSLRERGGFAPSLALPPGETTRPESPEGRQREREARVGDRAETEPPEVRGARAPFEGEVRAGAEEVRLVAHEGDEGEAKRALPGREPGTFAKGLEIRKGHGGRIAAILLLLVPLLSFSCRRSGRTGRKPRPVVLAGISFGKDPIRLPGGREVSRARYRDRLVELQGGGWLRLKALRAFLLAEAGGPPPRALVLGVRRLLGGAESFRSWLPVEDGAWTSESARLDLALVCALLLRRAGAGEGREDPAVPQDVGVLRDLLERAALRHSPRAEWVGGRFLGICGDRVVGTELLYPDILALASPRTRERAALTAP